MWRFGTVKDGAEARMAGATIAVTTLPACRRAPMSCRHARGPAPPQRGIRSTRGWLLISSDDRHSLSEREPRLSRAVAFAAYARFSRLATILIATPYRPLTAAASPAVTATIAIVS